MRTFTNTTGSKSVKISQDATGIFRAIYVQVYKNEEQVLESKNFTTINRASKWANKILN